MWLLALALTVAGTAVDTGAPSAQVKSLLQNCDAHKFETTIDVTVGGVAKKSRVKLCGTEGQNDADWLHTLQDAETKTLANPNMPAPVRKQIVAALNLEILRLTSAQPVAPTRKSSALEGISSLPPIPDASQPPPAASLPQPRTLEPVAPLEAYSSLPPMPSTPAAPVHLLPAEAAGAIPLLPNLKLSLTCYVPGETDDGPCTDFSRDTMLTVHANEDLPAGTSLRFLRSGERHGDIGLAELKRGKQERFALPAEVCRGVNGGRLEIRIVRASSATGSEGQEVGSNGPFALRC